MPRHSSVVGVVGLGSVGRPLLTLLHTAGYEVIGVDQHPDVLARVERRMRARTASGAGRSGGYTLTNDTVALVRADVVVEAVPDDLAVKTEVLRRLHAVCLDRTVLVGTSASLSLPHLAIASGRPARTLGLRMLRPPAPGAAVEPLSTAMSSDDAVAALDDLLDGLGLAAAPIGARPGAAATAMLYAYLNRAVRVLEQGYAGQEAVDTAMRLGCGLAEGPLQLLDEIGLDTVRAGLAGLLARTGEEAYRPAALLESMARSGLLGRKTGRGFYVYDELGRPLGSPAPPTDAPAASDGIRRVGVLGSGTMARGIAEAVAVAGFRTVLVARGTAQADAAREAVEASLTASVRRGRIDPRQKRTALGLLDTGDRQAELAECDLVIEATAEDLALKRRLFATLGGLCRPGALLATTTSSLSVAACAEAAGRPEDVLGLHFFNPAPVMRLVELVTTARTGAPAAATARVFCERLGKTVVPCADRAGFIVNHLLFPYLTDAVRLLDGRDAHDADIERIDAAVARGLGHPMGPFALLDTIGLDVSLAILRRLDEEFPDGSYAPPLLLEQLVARGCLGRKSGQGFHRTPAPARLA
ncbi:3-hydroxyacyl-CoA dehydrogenase family protein [Streptomyces sp. NPDC058991]|uniref:3-hydroxyacyl-CoA dehydrogenase family protein n=1 Tax=unclassified Streptomyces TaxID=2593676 RepID=UPI00367A7906